MRQGNSSESALADLLRRPDKVTHSTRSRRSGATPSPQEQRLQHASRPSRISNPRRTIGSGSHHLNRQLAASPTQADLTKSYAHAPPKISTGREAPMRRGVEG